jgi:DNA-binding IclR family transcriptional regulator
MPPTTARIPLPKRITAYLRRATGPQHYTVIARHIRASHASTYRACHRMMADGRLRGVSEGRYALAKEATPHAQ